MRKGRFEHANGGTLFLDEVGDMPLSLQAKLLRVLENQEVYRIGSNETIKVNVRLLSATNRDLEAAVTAGTFRQDLYYRLKVVTVRLPSMRERREDIPLLLDHFMRRSAEISGLPARGIGPDALAWLQAYDWPGNVRQLRNVVDWLLIMAPGEPGELIRADMLPPDIGSIAPSPLRGNDGL